MPRAQFDRNEVVDNSMTLFWQHGFNSASMQQVIEATGLKPGSLYLAFGSKEGLYREALEHFSERGFARIRQVLEEAPSVGHGLCQLLESFIQESGKHDYCSCFLIKTQLELAAEGGELYDFARHKLAETEALYQHYLEPEYGSEDSAIKAASLMLHIFGIRVYGYQADSLERMRTALQTGLPWLPWSQ